jgi:hypothetical protein
MTDVPINKETRYVGEQDIVIPGSPLPDFIELANIEDIANALIEKGIAVTKYQTTLDSQGYELQGPHCSIVLSDFRKIQYTTHRGFGASSSMVDQGIRITVSWLGSSNKPDFGTIEKVVGDIYRPLMDDRSIGIIHRK